MIDRNIGTLTGGSMIDLVCIDTRDFGLKAHPERHPLVDVFLNTKYWFSVYVLLIGPSIYKYVKSRIGTLQNINMYALQLYTASEGENCTTVLERSVFRTSHAINGITCIYLKVR